MSQTLDTTTEREFRYTATGPEIELLEVILLAHLNRFAVTVTQRDDRCHVRLLDRDTNRFLEGHGAGFEEAWRSLTAPDLAGLDLTFGEKIAARGQSTADSLAVMRGRAE